jgi:hypothetical protein
MRRRPARIPSTLMTIATPVVRTTMNTGSEVIAVIDVSW